MGIPIVSITKINCLILFREIIAAYAENQAKELLIKKKVVQTVTTGL
jgi:hypothetical protein